MSKDARVVKSPSGGSAVQCGSHNWVYDTRIEMNILKAYKLVYHCTKCGETKSTVEYQ